MKQIIIIEDNPNHVESFKNIIKSRHDGIYDVVEIKSAYSLHKIEDMEKSLLPELENTIKRIGNNIAAIFLDIFFEKLTIDNSKDKNFGFAIGSRIRDNYLEIPIIVFSSIAESEGYQKAIELDFDGFISKDAFNNQLTKKDLVSVIASGQNKRDKLKETFSKVMFSQNTKNRHFNVNEPKDIEKGRRTILVFMPYKKGKNNFYESVKLAITKINKEKRTNYVWYTMRDNVEGIKITDKIFSYLLYAPMIIAVATGSNPNVMYEIGLSHALNKPTALFVDSEKRLPFVLENVKVNQYQGINRSKLIDKIKEAIVQELFD